MSVEPAAPRPRLDGMRVGFVGLGQMGGPMAANLARAGCTLAVHNRTQAKAEAFAAGLSGCAVQVCATPAEVGAAADVVVTMLPDAADVEAVYLGAQGIAEGLRPGSVAVDMSTAGPQVARRLSEALGERGVALVDAPVSGSVAYAAEGTLTLMIGGDDATVERVLPLLSVLGRRIFHLGPVGSGAVMKLVVNTIVYGLNQALSEALVLAERSGIERTAAYAVIAESAVAAPFVHYRRAAFENPETAPPAMRIVLAAKDIVLTEALAREAGVALPQAQVNLQMLAAAAGAGFGDADVVAVADYLRSLAAQPEAAGR